MLCAAGKGVPVQNKIVVRYSDGRTLKGHTADFLPTRPSFHVVPTEQKNATPKGTVEIQLSELKAVFFVRDFTGNPAHHEARTFPAGQPPAGRRIRVEFVDGEVLVGTTLGYQANRPGFFLVPADPNSNNERCYVVSAAVRKVEFV
jgi:hypothetical protein